MKLQGFVEGGGHRNLANEFLQFPQTTALNCRARFPKETPLIRELYREWAAAAGANGKTALSARCHAAAGDAGAAAAVIAKGRTRQNIWERFLLLLPGGVKSHLCF